MTLQCWQGQPNWDGWSLVRMLIFLVITNQWLKTGREFSGLVYVHQLRLTIGQAIQDLTLIAQVLDPEDMRNRIQYLPL